MSAAAGCQELLCSVLARTVGVLFVAAALGVALAFAVAAVIGRRKR